MTHRTAEIKDTVVRELRTTANGISGALGKVDWKSVGKVAISGHIIAGLGVAIVLTGGAGAATSTAASGGSSLLSNPLVKNGVDNLIDTTVGAVNDVAHGRDVTLGSLATDFALGTITSGGSTKKASGTSGVMDDAFSGTNTGRAKNNIKPVENAVGDHSVFKTDSNTGKITNYKTYEVNPKNPSGFQEVKGYDGVGAPHTNKVTGEKLMPHIHDKNVPGGVRSPMEWEIPR